MPPLPVAGLPVPFALPMLLMWIWAVAAGWAPELAVARGSPRVEQTATETSEIEI